MSVEIETIRKTKAMAADARDGITTKHKDHHVPKVCCCCDRLLLYGDENYVMLSTFEHINVQHSKLRKSNTELSVLPARARKRVQNFYTPRIYSRTSKAYKTLSKLYLSPRSYEVDVRGEKALGACGICKSAINAMKREDHASRLPVYAIANGLIIGEPPDELKCLNDVEVAMISLARIDKHVFSIQGGAHKQMTGWHTMYANDVSHVSKTANWCAQNLDVRENADGEFVDDEQTDDDTEDENEDDNTESGEVNENRIKLATICVILSGPFTQEQLAVARQKTNVDWNKIRGALAWLKRNNALYRAEDIDETKVVKPVFMEKVDICESENRNVEKTYEFHAVFPDSTEPRMQDGGCKTREGFKEVTIERIATQTGNVNATLVSRPTTNVLRDYVGDNLMLAFPLQFPYGIGGTDVDGEFRSGKMFLKHLSSMSSKYFQRADFVCVLHNMFERTRMVSQSYVTHKFNTLASQYGSIDEEQLASAVDRFLNGNTGTSVADSFLRKMKAVTCSMAHTEEAAKRARQKVYANLTYRGMPALMVTVTPVDDHNFRIKLFVEEKTKSCAVPNIHDETSTLESFLISCREIRREYPGFCALDYENVMRIVIEIFLGWDRKKGVNKPNVGIFGDVEAYVVATEEQGRKTLHGHILVWVKNWSTILNGLNSENVRIRRASIEKIRTYAGRIITTEMFGNEANC